MTKPIVSVLIDTYNQEHFIEQALASVLEQGLSPSELEIVVVDDGSTDNTSSLVAKFAPRVRYIRKENGGQISAYSVGFPETSAPFVAFLDADDWWAKGKLQAVLDVFDNEPSTTAVGHGFVRVHEQSGTSETCVPAETYHLSLRNPEVARFAYSGRPFLGTSKLSVRRDILTRIGCLPDKLIFFDVPVQLLAMAFGDAVVLDQPLGFYRLHRDNLYESQSANQQNVRRKYEILKAYLEFLPPSLGRSGVSPDTVSAVLQPDQLECERLRLVLENGWPWETFGLERMRLRRAYERYSVSYALFKWFVLAATLFMPPRRFYHLRDWYSEHNLRRFRKILGEPVPAPAIQAQRRKVASPQ